MNARRSFRADVCKYVAWSLLLSLLCASGSNAQLLYSFESGLDGWTATDVTLANSTTLGVTDGAKSMLMDDLLSAFHNDVGHVTNGAGSGTAFTYWDAAAAAIAAGKTNVKLEFDFSYDLANVTGSAAFAQLGMFVNSTGGGFKQYGTGGLIGGNVGTGASDLFPRLDPAAIADGVTLTSLGPNTIHLAIPLGPTKSLNVGGGSPGTNFYQMGFKSNGGWGGSVDWAIDNVRLSGVQKPRTQETLFSWETADNPATPSVDERFEGWIPGNFPSNPPHVHSIVTTGATEGTHALQIDRTSYESGFTWGSLFQLNSDTNPDPQVETIDPVIQARIESLIGKVEAADFVAFDVTYQYVDRFPLPDPTFTTFGVHFSDETGKFYQASGSSLNVAGAASPTTTTIEIPLANFVDAANNMLTLKNTGLQNDSNFFRIGISTSTDGAQIYQIDNFRLITELPEGVPGDYNGNGVVDTADYVLWRNGGPLQNEVDTPGTVNAADYTAWRARFGNTSGSGSLSFAQVPEPASGMFALLVLMLPIMSRRDRF